MKKPDSTHKLLETLTPHEASVLRQRFGLDADSLDIGNADDDLPPPPDGNNNTGGGAPAAPLPPIPDIKTR